MLSLSLVICSCKNVNTSVNGETADFSNNDATVSTESEINDNTTVLDVKSIVVNGTTFSVQQINDGIKNAFNNSLYYHGKLYSDFLDANVDLVLNKGIEYDLFYAPEFVYEYSLTGDAQTLLPEVIMVITNMEYPVSIDGTTQLYMYGIVVTEQGFQTDFNSISPIPKGEKYNFLYNREAIPLGTYTMCISEITQPLHEKMSDEWKIQTEEAIRMYMDANDFYINKEMNLLPGEYHIYVEGFSKSDVHSEIVFEHENGNIYMGEFYFVHNYYEGKLANLNKVQLVEINGSVEEAYYADYLGKLLENSPLVMEYTIQE